MGMIKILGIAIFGLSLIYLVVILARKAAEEKRKNDELEARREASRQRGIASFSDTQLMMKSMYEDFVRGQIERERGP